jgi:hypothetical protein
LIKALPHLPGREGKDGPVTIEVGHIVCVRAKEQNDEEATELVLPRSQADGPPVRLVTNRRYLHRALKLGFHELFIATADQPIICRDESRLFLWMPLDDKTALPPSSQPRIPTTAEPNPVTPNNERNQVMPTPHPDGAARRNGEAPAQETTPAACGIDEVIAEADALRTVLSEAVTRISRLAAGLKRQRRQGRALEAALASLRQFQPPHR